jgi:hypothetical protein
MSTRRFLRQGVSLLVLACVVLTTLGAEQLTAPLATWRTAVPIATRKYEVDGVLVELLSVTRSNSFLTVRWQYRNTTDKTQLLGEHAGASGPYSLSWDFRVIANGKAYTVPGQTLAKQHGPDKIVVLGPKKVYTNWAKVEDPGPDVKTVSVIVQGADPFDDVTVT